MAADETIHVGLDFDLSDAQQKLETFRSSFEGLKQSFQDAPNATRAFNQGLDRSLDLVDMMSKKIDKANKSGNLSDASFQQDITSGLGELEALSKLFSGGGSFDLGASMASFKGLSASVQKELDSITQDISNMIRSNIRSLKSSTIAGMTRELMGTDYAQEIFGRTKHVEGKDFANYIKMMLPSVAPSYLFDDYNQVRYGTTYRGSRTTNPLDVIPNAFKASYKAKSYVGMSKPESGGFLQSDYRNIIRDMVMENDAALRAAEATDGMLRYKKNGRASLAYNISPEMYDKFRENLFNDFVRRASGSASNRIDIFDEALDGSERRKLIGRMTGSSTGRVLRAMDRLEAINGEGMWGDALSKKAYEDLEREAKRSLEQYEISKYRFGDLANGNAKARSVTLSESQNTRMLGLSGHHNEFTDKVLLISTDGYDRTDAKQQAYMEELLSGKPVAIPGTGKSYIRQNVHGTGENTVIRMVEADEYNRIRKKEEAWAKENGFVTSDGKGANYWNDFIPDDYDFETVQKLRKHYDATGKGWSPGYRVQGDFGKSRQFDENKPPFGVVDLSKILDDKTKQKLADGLGWFTGGVLPVDDFQGRMGVAGKGTFHRLKGFSTLGEWARAVGLADKDGRFILPGPRGDVDLTDMSGMTDVSTIKNTQAYDNFKTSNEYNAGFSKMLQRYGMSVMQSYEDAETRARGIGSQAMAFIKLSPKMQDEQIKEYARRMRLLDTESGVKEYLLGDPDNYLAEKVKAGEMSVSDPVIQSWVRAERESLANRFAAGEWIDFGDQPSVINQKANKSPIASVHGIKTDVDRKTLLDNIRAKYKEKTKEDLTISDEDLAGVFALNAGQIVDFARPNEENVSVIRSPSGFGNFVAGKNYANIAKSIYEAFGISTKGLYLSEPDMFQLGGADFDGDAVKTVYGNIGAAVKEAKELHDKAIEGLGLVIDPETKNVKLPDVSNYQDTGLQQRLNLEAAMDAGLHMGSSSSAGMRAATVDLYSPRNRDYLVAALQSNAAYRDTTAEVKAATETEMTDEMKKALYLNAQWSKLPTRYERFFNVTGQNDLDIPDAKDIATIRVGDNDVDVNLDELRKVDFDKINFRSVYSGSDLGGLRSAMAVSSLGVDTTKAQALLRALDENIGYGDAGEKTKALMQNLRMMKVMDIVNPGAIMSDDELANLEAMTRQAEEEIRQQANKLSQGKKIKQSDGSEVSYDSYVQKKLNEYGVSSAKAFIDHGIHARSLRNVYGDKAAEYFPEFFDPSRQALTLPNHAEVAELQRVNVEEQQKIVEAKEQEIKQIDQEIQERQNRIKSVQTEASNDETPEQAQLKQEIESLKQQKAEAERQRDSASSEIKKTYDYISAQEQYNALTGRADDFSNNLYSSIRKKEQRLAETPQAELYYNRNYGMARALQGHLKTFSESDVFKQLPADFQQDILERINGENSMLNMVEQDFADTAELKAKQLSEKFSKANKRKSGRVSSMELAFEQYDKDIKTVQEYRDQLEENLKTKPYTKEQREAFEKKLANADSFLSSAKQEADQLKITEITSALDKIQNTTITDPFEKLTKGAQDAKEQVNGLEELLKKTYKEQGLSEEQIAEKMKPYEGLTNQIDKNFELQKEQQQLSINRRSRQTDQMISQMDRIKMGRAGYYSNSIAGRAARQVQQELWQRRSVQDQYQTQLEQWQIEQKKYTDGNGNITNQEQYDNAAQHIEKLNAAIAQNKAAMASLNGVGGTTAAVFGQIGQAVDGLLMRLGRQMFQKALAEAKRFIQEFDSSMNEIQAITLKSDTQMQPIRNQTIQKAIGMRTSVSNVANTEAALYRQGLSDQEVSSRTDAIIKFATVTKLNVTEATKIITTALQNDLVPSAEAAMDALVALGDSAATTAAEIGKGMQKAAASAKVAGVSYAELTSLLTLGTSDTQLSGTQVGTALQTVFTRMRRISMSGFASDQNGDKTTASDAEAALQSIGVDLYSDKNQGKMRGAYEILRDIAKVWEHLSDVQKSLVTNAMAGTRQTNIFSTLMEGMSENGGERMDEYLGLADGSQGITQSKYEIAMQSLSAAMNEFKSSFDSMVESLVSNGTITGVIDGLSGIFQWISGIASTDAGRVGVVFSAIAAGITAIGVAAATAKFGLGPISTILGLLVGLLAGGGLMGLTSLFSMPSQAEKAAAQREKDRQDVQDKKEVRDSAQTIRQDAIDNVRKLGKAYDELKDSQDNLAKSDAASKLTTGLYELKDAFPELSEEILNAIQNLSGWEAAVDSADKKGQEYLKKNAEQYVADVYANQTKNAQAEYEARLNSETFTEERINGLRDTVKNDLVDIINPNYYDGNKDGDPLADFAKGKLHSADYNEKFLQKESSRKSYRQAAIDLLKNPYNKSIDDRISFLNTTMDSAVSASAKIKDKADALEYEIETNYGSINYNIDTEIAELENEIDEAEKQNKNRVRANEFSGLTAKAFNVLSSGKGVSIGDEEAKLLQDLYSGYSNKTDDFEAFEKYLSNDTNNVLERVFSQLGKGEDMSNILMDPDIGILKRIYTDLSSQTVEGGQDKISALEKRLDSLRKQQKLQADYFAANSSLEQIGNSYDNILLPERDKLVGQRDAHAKANQTFEDEQRNYSGAVSDFNQSKTAEDRLIVGRAISLYNTNSDFKAFVDSRYSTDETALALKSGKTDMVKNNLDKTVKFMQRVVGDLNDPKIIEQFQDEMNQISKSFASDMIKQYVGSFTTKQYGEEFMTTLLENMFKSEAYDQDGNFKDTFTDDEGLLDTGKVADWVLDKFNKYRGAEDPTAALVQANKKHAEYPYYFHRGQEDEEGFMDYESARDWIITHSGLMTGLTDKDGNKLYQSAGSNIDALIQKSNEGNANIMLQNFLEGKDYTFKDKKGTERIAHIGGLDSYKTIQGLEKAYDRFGLNGEISTLLAQNPTMLGLYAMAKNVDPEKNKEAAEAAYERFKEAAKKMEVGQVSGSAIYDAVMEGLQTGRLNVTDLRTDSTYTEVYAAFKSFAGEAADEYLNAIESGAEAGVDENIEKAVNKSVAANRIKEKMQFIPGYSTFSQNALTEMYGTDTERFSLRKQQVSSAADLDSYNAAVQRYKSGEAKEADFAIIAGRSMYSETQLRNQYRSETQDSMNDNLQSEVDMYYADKVAEANNTIEAMREAKISPKDLRSAYDRYIEQGYVFDHSKNVFTSYTPKDEDEITFAARRASYNRQANESNLASMWNDLSSNTDWSDAGITSYLIKRKYGSDQINKLLEDSTFRNALNLGMSPEYMRRLAKRRSTGEAGTFDENYGEWVKKIFGEDADLTSEYFAITPAMRGNYLQLVKDGHGDALNEMFSAMAGGDIFREILAGGEGDIDSAIQQYTDQKYADLFKGVKNGQQLAQDVTTFKAGTATAQAQTAEQYINTVRAQQQAQWAIDAISKDSANNTAENRSMITSLLGLNDVDVKRMIDEGNTDEIKNRIKNRVKETQADLLKMFNGFFDDLDMDNTDWNEIKTRIDGMSSGPLKDLFDAIFAAYNLAGQVRTDGTVNGRNVKNLGELFDQAKTGFADRAQAYEGYTKLHEALSKKGKDNNFDNWLKKNPNPEDRTDQSFEELLNGIDKDFDWSSFMSKNSGAALILKMIQDGRMSPKDAAVATQYSQFNGQQTSAYTDAMLTTLFGGGFGKEYDLFNNGEIDTSKLSDLSTLLETIQGDEAGAAALDELTSRFESLNNAINALNLGELENAKKYLRDFNEEIKKKRADDYAKYGDYAEDVANAMDLFSKNTKKASAAQKSFNQEISRVSKNQYARNQWSKGKRDKDTISQIAQMTELSESFIKDKKNKSLIDGLLKNSERDDKKAVEAWANGMSEDLSQALTKSFNGQTIELDNGVNIDLKGGSANIDFSNAISQLGGALNATQQDIIKQLQQWGVKGHVEITKNGDTVSARIVIDSLGKGSKGGGGGGGGGKKKTAGEKLIEKQKQSTAINDHEIKMVKSQEDYYESRSEFGYLNETINAEQTIRRRYGRRLEKQNKELHNQLKHTKRGTEEWYKLRDAIMANEEAQKENTNAIDANTRKIKENQSAIRKLRMDLEDTVRTEIETRIKEKRDMLESRASMEQTILGIIQERYRKEWDLIKRDIDKKKEALEEEKKLIDERLQARKNAADKASKYEELAELQNQLAMISMDSTRTKDAADLRKRIADLQGDIAWGTAEDEANNQKEALDDRIQAYDEFEQRGDEALEKYLEDANNFAGEVNKVLKMSQKDLIKWLEKNDDEYKNSLNNTKKSIVEGWTDLYKQMKGITDTYWKEINKILGSKKSYINYMKGSSEYKNASKTEQKEMEYQWGLQYDNYTAALKTGSKYSHSDDWASGEGKKDDKKGGSGSGGGGGTSDSRAENGGKPLHGYRVTGTKTKTFPILDAQGKQKKDKNGNLMYDSKDTKISKEFSLSSYKNLSYKEVKQKAQQYIDQLQAKKVFYNSNDKSFTSYSGLKLNAYREGGVVDYTGPAWVDGTPTKPEAFLSAIDTKNIRDLLDAFNYIKSPRMTYYDTIKNMGNTNNSIGEVSVTINGATFEDDADYEKIAQRVGEEFAKELQRQGFSTARYNF